MVTDTQPDKNLVQLLGKHVKIVKVKKFQGL